MKTKYWKNTLLLGFTAAMLLIGACTPMDHYYKDLVKLGDRQHAGKVVGEEVRPGRERAEIAWKNPSDPAVHQVIVYWNDYRDSVQVNLSASSERDSVVVEVPEGLYVMNLISVDEAGNRSLPVEINVETFGDRYQETLRNRVISNVAGSAGSALVVWNEEFQETLMSTEITYTDRTGQSRSVSFEKSELSVELPGVDLDEQVAVQSTFLPDTLAIDSFQSDVEYFDLNDFQLRELSLIASNVATSEFIDFSSVIVYGREDATEVPETIDLAHMRGSSSAHNFIVITNSAGFGAFNSTIRNQIDAWSVRNDGILVRIDDIDEGLALYHSLDEDDRDGMIAAFDHAVATEEPTNRLVQLDTDEVVLFHSVDRDIYVAIHILESVASGNMRIGFKISKP